MASEPRLRLNDGNEMPQLGFGVWRVPEDATAEAVGTALATGYRLIDTAAAYGNEEGVGAAIAGSGVARGDIFLTTKLANRDQGHDQALRAFDASLKRLGTDYVDLYLIHWPRPAAGEFPDTWRALVRLKEEGRARSIGVSNFTAAHIERIVGDTGTTPAVNQIELHPRFQQAAMRNFHKARGIVTQSWSPLGRGHLDDNDVLTGIGAKHGKSWAQVILRWNIQLGVATIPKSVTPARIAANRDIFDFELDADDLVAIAGLDTESGRAGGNPDTVV